MDECKICQWNKVYHCVKNHVYVSIFLLNFTLSCCFPIAVTFVVLDQVRCVSMYREAEKISYNVGCNIPYFHYRPFLVLYSASSCMLLEFSKAIKLGSRWNSNPFQYFSNQVSECICGNIKSNYAIRSM
jgi:hypothetical protein